MRKKLTKQKQIKNDGNSHNRYLPDSSAIIKILVFILLMEEIQHPLIGSLSHYLQKKVAASPTFGTFAGISYNRASIQSSIPKRKHVEYC